MLPELQREELIAILHLVQQFDPAGVAALDLQECLLIQLRRLPESPLRAGAIKLVRYFFDKLAARDYQQIKRRMKIDDQELAAIITLIQQQSPRPGTPFHDSRHDYITPDLFVRKVEQQWRVAINPDNAPKLRVNHHYVELMRSMSEGDLSTMRSHLQEAHWFIKSLQSRNDTLLKVAERLSTTKKRF